MESNPDEIITPPSSKKSGERSSKTNKQAGSKKDGGKRVSRSQTKQLPANLSLLKQSLSGKDPNSKEAKDIKKALSKHMLQAVQSASAKPKAADYTKIIREN